MMKAIVPWACLVAISNVSSVFADTGLDAYRTGHYYDASQIFNQSTTHDPVASYYMGRMRLYGYGELKNNEQAIRYFKESGEKGYLPAQNIMARIMLLQYHNPDQALYWFKKAADLNDVQAQMYCAAAYLYGFGTKPNDDVARRYYIAAAKNGNAIAQYELASHFINSRQGGNKTLGLLWLNKSVSQENPDALLLMARLYASGKIVTLDLNKAQSMTQQLADKGYPPAMYQMGEFARILGNVQAAKDWYSKAAKAHNEPAQIALARLYLQDKSPLYDVHTGFLLTLDAAQNGSIAAQSTLADLYQAGIGVEKDENLAKEWRQKASAQERNPQNAEIAMLKWLSNGKARTFADAGIVMPGILSAWQNVASLKENIYNKSPKLDNVDKDVLFRAQFVMTDPNQIEIRDYLAQWMRSAGVKQDGFKIPRYSLIHEANADHSSVDTEQRYDYLDPSNLKQNNGDYQTLFPQLERQAILGDAMAQFDLGQMYHYGKGVAKNMEQAIKYYTMAAKQQDLRAEYTLALIYLEGDGIAPNYQNAMMLLRDAAFKGNLYAQYVVASIDEQGYRDASNAVVIPADPAQAMAMYDLAAANNFGLAQYRLAQILISAKPQDLSVNEENMRHALIKSLYQGAMRDGVSDAALPLAFYQAAEPGKDKQVHALSVVTKAANAGNAQAQLLLGLMYDRGIGVALDHQEAIRWYQKSGSNVVSDFILGTYMSQGMGMDKQIDQGKALLAKAAQSEFSYASLNLAVLQQQNHENFLNELNQARTLGNAKAGLLLADYYVSSADHNDSHMKQALDIYQQFANKGDLIAQYKLGYLLENGLSGAKDMPMAEKWYLAAASSGQPTAQYLLGRFYQLGRLNNTPDYDNAKKWYGSAQQQYAPAAVALGFIYDTVDDNYQDAKKSYEIASALHDPIGEYDLALMYVQGKGQAVSPEKAQAMFQMSAQQGYGLAMLSLADQYFNGELGDRDEREALFWYKKAADVGNVDALYQLGLLSETGVATTLNYNEAVHYYQQAADKGDMKAKLALARMYQYGLGVTKDPEHAEALYQELSAKGNGYAQYQLALLNKDAADKANETRRLLQQAEGKGIAQARKTLQWMNAQKTPQVSFIESVPPEASQVITQGSAELMYLDALNAWNSGDETSFRMILSHILGQYPNYLPAKHAYDQLTPDAWG